MKGLVAVSGCPGLRDRTIPVKLATGNTRGAKYMVRYSGRKGICTWVNLQIHSHLGTGARLHLRIMQAQDLGPGRVKSCLGLSGQ